MSKKARIHANIQGAMRISRYFVPDWNSWHHWQSPINLCSDDEINEERLSFTPGHASSGGSFANHFSHFGLLHSKGLRRTLGLVLPGLSQVRIPNRKLMKDFHNVFTF